MKISIQSETVRRNIELFKELIRRQGKKDNSFSPVNYAAFVNLTTGDIQFSGMFNTDGLDLHKKQWKPIHIQVKAPSSENSCVFELTEDSSEEKFFQHGDFNPSAYKIMIETIKTLNFISSSLKNLKDIKRVLKEVSNVEIGILGKDIIHEAWHHLNRLEAEQLLQKQAPGTFIFRKDEYAIVLEHSLAQSLRTSIKCLTLTYLDESGRVIDKTIIQNGNEWLVYNDDPNLCGPVYSTIYALLEEMDHEVQNPLIS